MRGSHWCPTRRVLRRAMSDGVAGQSGYSVEDYFALVRRGVLREDDRVELLDGVIVAEPPMDPAHATGITATARALARAIGDRAVLRVQMPLIAGGFSVPAPDVAIVAGTIADYATRHPATALLVVEVAATSLPQDRLSKSRIYAGAGVPELWIVNLRDACVEISRRPDVPRRVYVDHRVARRGERLTVAAFPDVIIDADELLPG